MYLTCNFRGRQNLCLLYAAAGSIALLAPCTVHCFQQNLPHLNRRTFLKVNNERSLCQSFLSGKGADDEDDEEENATLIDFEESDWRDFRAKLVGGNSAVSTEKNEGTWAYDSGKVIEEGSIILSSLEQDFGYGLRQQYLHKCVILVLSHDDNAFTKGIILNRPSDLVLSDEDFMYEDGTDLDDLDNDNKWNVWFGGDVQGASSDDPEMVCLHRLESQSAKEFSNKVMKGIHWTTFEEARRLVQDGEAQSTDFWVFCGYSSWGPGQLNDELERESWSMVAADSETLLKEMQRQSISRPDPRDAGIDTWNLLMKMIGREDEVRESVGDFDDLMLREWAREHLVYNRDETEENVQGSLQKLEMINITNFEQEDFQSLNQMFEPVTDLSGALSVGTILRASSEERSPFLLENQEFHKSTVLIIKDEEDFTIGLLLNHPLTTNIKVVLLDENLSEEKELIIPRRYGGKFELPGTAKKPIFWYHYSSVLRDAKIGSPLGEQVEGVWKCSEEDALDAIKIGIAEKQDFLCVIGFTMWPKGEDESRSLASEVACGAFEIVPESKTQDVWDALVSQDSLSFLTIDRNLMLGHSAWIAGGSDVTTKKGIGKEAESFSTNPLCVFESDVQIAALSDDALRCWIAASLLGAPVLRHSNSAFS